MKKGLSALLALLMSILLSVPAFAAGIVNTGGDYMHYVYIAAAVGGVVLILAVVLFILGRKK